MIAYRKAAPPDTETLARLRGDMLCDETGYPEAFASLLRTNTAQFIADGLADRSVAAWVATDGDRIIAMGCVNFFSLPPNDWCPSGKTAYIGNLYTLPAYRKQGIGGNLLTRLVEEAKSRHCERILLHATDKGRPLYKAHGFEGSPTAMACYPFGILPSA